MNGGELYAQTGHRLPGPVRGRRACGGSCVPPQISDLGIFSPAAPRPHPADLKHPDHRPPCPKTGGSAVRKPAASAGGAASAAEGPCGILASFPSGAEGRGPSSGAFPDAAHADPARVSLPVSHPVSHPVCRSGTARPSPGRAALPAGGRRPFHPETPIFIFLKQNANTGQTNWLYSPFR